MSRVEKVCKVVGKKGSFDYSRDIYKMDKKGSDMNLIFDFDGTICDSLDSFLSIVNPILKKLRKREIAKKEVRVKGAIRLIHDLKVPKLALPFMVIYGRYRCSRLIPTLKPFPQIPEVLGKLAKTNTLGIVTSNSEGNVRSFLENNKLDSYFSFIHQSVNFLDKSSRISTAIKKYELNVSDCVFIGDETRDILSAKKVGILAVGVTWGTEGQTLLSRSRPDYIVRKPSDLIHINY